MLNNDSMRRWLQEISEILMNDISLKWFYNLIYSMIKLVIKQIKWQATVTEKFKLRKKINKIFKVLFD